MGSTLEHPAVTLFRALDELRIICSNAPLFRELGERRKRERVNAPSLSNEPADDTKYLRDVILQSGSAACERAREALRDGGAAVLGAGTEPDAPEQVASNKLHTKLWEASGVFGRLHSDIDDPRAIIDEYAASMADLGEWFECACDELGSLLDMWDLFEPDPTPTATHATPPTTADGAEIRGGDLGNAKPPAPSAEAATTTTLTYPTMSDLATEGGISDDTLRRVREAAGIKVNLKGGAARNRRYSPKEVDRLIEAALAGNYLERTSMARKWAQWGSNEAASKPHARR